MINLLINPEFLMSHWTLHTSLEITPFNFLLSLSFFAEDISHLRFSEFFGSYVEFVMFCVYVSAVDYTHKNCLHKESCMQDVKELDM